MIFELSLWLTSVLADSGLFDCNIAQTCTSADAKLLQWLDRRPVSPEYGSAKGKNEKAGKWISRSLEMPKAIVVTSWSMS